ncbi:MAG: error-prone DNA polymerase [Steroidobacteraceae bacterium]
MYAELHCLSNFTFLRGASSPEELVRRAAQLGYTALALTDECSVAGVVRAHVAAKAVGLKLIIGSEFRLVDGLRLVVLATSRRGYAELCRLITVGRRAAEKGSYHLKREDFSGFPSAVSFLQECIALWLPGSESDPDEGAWVRDVFPGRAWIATELLSDGIDRKRLSGLRMLSRSLAMPLVASGDVHMHVPERRPLQDAVTAIRIGVPLASAGLHLHANGERHLRPLARIRKRYPADLLAQTIEVAKGCDFSLDEVRYEYPDEIVPQGATPASYLRQLAEEGMQRYWPAGVPDKVRIQVDEELALIHELNYEAFFLTVYDVVKFARSVGILCQGRGSAANSAVCYCIGITAVDPARSSLLFGRFLSKERNEPPDIDVDFEHERREEVIQYIYRKYGRHRAALAATVITYQPRSAIRDLGKALGLDVMQTDRLARTLQWWDGKQPDAERIREAGLDPQSPLLRQLFVLVGQLCGFPRHLSQHVGGFVIARDSLDNLVPVENAAMPERTVIQWEKDDLEALGLLKVDVLALGMLTTIRRSFDLVRRFRGREYSFDGIPAEEACVYEMISEADTIGVFQIESRAQMSMLPRLKPSTFYDLVIEVAIVRPGPIQGGMVHPYLRRRTGVEPVSYPGPGIESVLSRTLGVPIFQEQVMQLAVVAAGFTPGEADQLRRAMAAWKRKGGLEPFEQNLIEGMRARGYEESFARQIFEQIKGFGDYGFPESHAASFALLVYVSAWLKRHEPAAFTAALLNSQPMGFYAPAQLVRDAREHHVEVRGVDVQCSDWESTLERRNDGEPALRLGFKLLKGLGQAAAERIAAAREAHGAFESVQRLAERTGLGRRELQVLAAGGALKSLVGDRHQAVWGVSGVEAPLPVFAELRIAEGTPLLVRPLEGQDIAADYRSLGLTLGRHPLALLRRRFEREKAVAAVELKALSPGLGVRVAGLVIGRQRPGNGNAIFVTLEDETGQVNLIVWASLAERQRKVLLGSRLLQANGILQREGKVIHVVARQLLDRSRWLGRLNVLSRDFH